MTGWGARLRPVLDFTAKAGMAHWSLHDLRRTMRTGLGALDVDPIIAELILNHALRRRSRPRLAFVGVVDQVSTVSDQARA